MVVDYQNSKDWQKFVGDEITKTRAIIVQANIKLE
jgi:hypothetical protein